MRGRETFVGTVVPFADCVCDLDVCVCAAFGREESRGVIGPGILIAAAEIEEFEGALGAVAGGDVTGWVLANVVCLVRVGHIGRCLDWESWRLAYMCANFEGTINRSSPTSALPVARTRFSPFTVRGMSVVPVWRPLRDHSVSPWRMMKTRGSGIAYVRNGRDSVKLVRVY